jgi:hypothetical protein
MQIKFNENRPTDLIELNERAGEAPSPRPSRLAGNEPARLAGGWWQIDSMVQSSVRRLGSLPISARRGRLLELKNGAKMGEGRRLARRRPVLYTELCVQF